MVAPLGEGVDDNFFEANSLLIQDFLTFLNMMTYTTGTWFLRER